MSLIKENILKKLKNEFPEIFDGEELSLPKLQNSISANVQIDGLLVVRKVLFEKVGNLSSRTERLVRLINRLRRK